MPHRGRILGIMEHLCINDRTSGSAAQAHHPIEIETREMVGLRSLRELVPPYKTSLEGRCHRTEALASQSRGRFPSVMPATLIRPPWVTT